jgi:methyl-accepting chemotaxis protein
MKPIVNNRKIRNYFISKEIQVPIAIVHLAYLILIAAVLIATVLSPFYADIFKSGDLMAKHFSAKMFIVMLERLSMAGMLTILISFIHFIVFTHKFCGPLVRIGRTIDRISEKDFTDKIYLRKGDFLKPEAQQINDMMRELSNSLELIKKENSLLLDDLEKSIQSHGKQAEIEAELKGFRDRAQRCRVQLSNFQLCDDNTNKVDIGQEEQLIGDNPLSADKCV